MGKVKITVIGISKYADIIQNIVHNTTNITFIGTANDVKEGEEYIRQADVVLLDIGLFEVNVESLLESVIQVKPVPIIVLADGSVNQTAKTVTAMSTGAVDFIKMKEKASTRNKEEFHQEVISKIIHARKTKVHHSKNCSKEQVHSNISMKNSNERKKIPIEHDSIVAIGCSTGGPRALHKLFSHIPKNFKSPILIVQHMPSGFTKSLAERLNNISKIHVKEASDGEIVKKGTAYIAPGDFHMIVEQKQDQLTIKLTKEKTRLGHRPSVDILLESIAKIKNCHKIIVILTGMGRDGAEGVKKIKQSANDAIVIAESDETAVINGMPSAAIATSCVTEILRIENIGEALVDYTNTRGY